MHIEDLFEELTGLSRNDVHICETSFARWIAFTVNSLEELMALAAEYRMEDELYYLIPNLLPNDRFEINKEIFGSKYQSLLVSALSKLQFEVMYSYDCGESGELYIKSVLHGGPPAIFNDSYNSDELSHQCRLVREHVSELEKEISAALDHGGNVAGISAELSAGERYLDLLEKISNIFAVPKYDDEDEARALLSF